MAKSKTLAVTVDRYYINKRLWAIKLMTISLSKHGGLLWKTQKTLVTHTALSKLTPMAIEYALDKEIPYISALSQGQVVLGLHKDLLEKHYGSKLSELII